jgi:hypothetical protein
MRHDYLDRSLSKEEEILPSSGFTASVMEAVRQEAATPPPIAFPWKRALPGLIVGCLTILWLLFKGVTQTMQGNGEPAIPSIFHFSVASVVASPAVAAVCWIVIALALSFASQKLAILLLHRNTI